MRGDLPAGMEAIWRSGDYLGSERRAFARVTVQHPQMRLDTFAMQSTFRRVPTQTSDVSSFNPYPSGIDPTRGEPITNTYADYLFTAQDLPKELPNVASVSWTRTVDADVAEATIEFWNTSPLPLGEKPENKNLDRPGFFTAGRGTATFSSRWKHEPNEWQNMLMPDNILRTYEGYGFDALVPPEQDSHLVITGVWMIDEVRLSSRGTLVCVCRDVGRLLLDHQNFLPVVPEDFYPTLFKGWDDTVTVQTQRNVIVESVNTERLAAWPLGSGNDLWPESAYTGASVYGHSHVHAFDNSFESYWLSVGNASPGYRSSFEYVDFAVGGATVSQVRFWTVGAGYNAYVSVKVGGQWLPGQIMGYYQDGRGRYEEGIPWIAGVTGLGGEGEHIISIGPIAGVEMIRLWVGNLQDFGLAGAKFRAGIREISAYGPVRRSETHVVIDVNQVNLVPGPAGSNPGTLRDFTDIVKLFCAWAGLYWPSDGYLFHSDGTQHMLAPTRPDAAVLGDIVPGRVWGDFQATGTTPPTEIAVSAFDKKSLADGIRYLADTVGFMFFIDETGAAQWRLPNVWTLGNWIGGMSPYPGRINRVLTIDERQILLGLDASIQSRNVREGVFVGNAVGQLAAMVGGYNPNPTGLRRIAGYCVDAETEIFTRRGWLKWDEVRPGDETLSINESTGRTVWQVIKDVAKFDAIPREMVDFCANNFSALTTPNHRWLTQTYSTVTRTWEWRWRTSETLTSLDRIPRALPRGDAPIVATHTDALVELVAWIYTEGCVSTGVHGRSRITIDQDRLANPEKCERIRLALKREFGDAGWGESLRRGSSVTWRLGVNVSAALLPHLGGRAKVPSMDFLTSLTKAQLDLFIEVSILGDGWSRFTSVNSKKKSHFFGQNVGSRLDAFEAACALAGVATSGHHLGVPAGWGNKPHASVTLVDSQFYLPKATNRPNSLKSVGYEGVVWCPTMLEHHTWLARRNGAAYFTGNTDQNFETVEEARVMADLIAVRQLFKYRQDQVVIPGFPGIQIDDQVRIFERVTSEGFVHYVKGIASNNDLQTGKWTHTLQTHWLGDDPNGRWVLDKSTLNSITVQYVDSLQAGTEWSRVGLEM